MRNFYVEVRISRAANRALLGSNKRVLLRQKISELAAEPLSQSANVKKLQGRPGYRLRVQDWRVVFRINGEVLWIDEIGPRGSVY